MSKTQSIVSKERQLSFTKFEKSSITQKNWSVKVKFSSSESMMWALRYLVWPFSLVCGYLRWFQLYLTENNVFAVFVLNFAVFSFFALEKGFSLFAANHTDSRDISLITTFLAFCCSSWWKTIKAKFFVWRPFDCIIGLCLTLYQEKQRFPIFIAKLLCL